MQIEIQNAQKEQIATLELTEDRTIPFNRLPVTKELMAQAGLQITFCFRLPIINVQGIWFCQHLGSSRPRLSLPWSIDVTSAQQSDIPYVALFSMDQTNTASIALTCIRDDVRIHGQMDQMRCTYFWNITVAIVPETEPFDLLISFMPKRWNMLLEDWRKLAVPDGPPAFPAAAFKPVYCTWYAAHAALTPDYLDRNAKLASELGFGTFIVDDGWSYDEMKRVCPEKMGEGWYRDIGNWTVSEKKLPDYKKHIEYAQSLGLKYLLWTSPFFAGVCSKEYLAVPEAERDTEFNGNWGDVALMEPDGKGAAHAVELLKNLMTDLNLDGLKIDFLDAITKDVNKPRSRACNRYFSKLAGAIRSVRPDALMEFRQSYATPQMMEFGTQFRAGDVPFDFMQNIIQLAQIHNIMGDRVPRHADPIYFNPQEKPVNVARHMIAALAGVPMFSMELGELTDEQNRIVRFWLGFYSSRLETFSMGHWNVLYAGDTLDYMSVEGKNEAVVIVCGNAHGPDLAGLFPGKKTYLLNLSAFELKPVSGASVRDCFGEIASGTAAPVAGMAILY